MNKKVWVMLFLSVAVSLSSCSLFTKERALKMNNTLVYINDSMYSKGQEWGQVLTDCAVSKEFGKLTPYRLGLEHFIDSSLTQVEGMSDVGGSGDLRTCEIDLLKFEKNMVSTYFAPFEQFTDATSVDEITLKLNAIQAASQDETVKMSRFKSLQESYAKKNGFKLETLTQIPQ